MNPYVYTHIAAVGQELTNDEIVALYLGLSLQAKPTQVKGFDKIDHLYTENGGGTMHSDTKECLMAYLQGRVNEISSPSAA